VRRLVALVSLANPVSQILANTRFADVVNPVPGPE
jgi:hypothetical protein